MHDYLGERADKNEICGGKHQTCSCDEEKKEHCMLVERDTRAGIRAIRPAANAATQTTVLYPIMQYNAAHSSESEELIEEIYGLTWLPQITYGLLVE